VVRPAARLHRHGAWWQTRNELAQLGARHARAHECSFTGLIDTVHGKHILGEIDADVDNAHGLPLLK